MHVSILGLGHVGCVSAACLAREGHTVVCVDVNPHKVALINSGRSPVREPELDAIVAAVVSAGQLRATLDVVALVPLAGFDEEPIAP